MPHTLSKNLNNNFTDKLKPILSDIERKGFSIFPAGNLTKDDFLNLAYSFGEVIPSGRGKSLIDDIYIGGELKQSSLPLHTDKSYWRTPPFYEVLYVNDVHNMQNGEIIVGDLLSSFLMLSSEDQKILKELKTDYKGPPNRDPSVINAKLVETTNDKISFFRYRLDIFDSSCPSILRWNEKIKDTLVMVPYKKGDVLILDNRLHCAGRNITTWSENGFRHLYRALVM